jgi:hypothetical protein
VLQELAVELAIERGVLHRAGPTAADTAVRQDRTARPSSSTVQAPHRPSPQPYLAPVSRRRSRSTASRLSAGGASTCRLAS